MRFNIRQKIFSFGDDFIIRNEVGEPILTVKGKVFSFGDKLRVYDANMNEIYYIEQKIFRLLPEYRIYQGQEEVAFLKKELSLFRPKINIQSKFGSFRIEGSIFQYNFQIFNGSSVVATVSKKLFSFSDQYTLDVLQETNLTFIVTLVIVIDQIIHDSNSSHSS